MPTGVYKRTTSHKRKISATLKGRKKSLEHAKNISLGKMGNKSNLWKGGLSPVLLNLRVSACYRRWRKDIFERDNYTCQICSQRGGKLEVDHYPKRFVDLCRENNIKTVLEGIECPALWATSLGRVLCVNCHRQTPNYGRKLDNTREKVKTLS